MTIGRRSFRRVLAGLSLLALLIGSRAWFRQRQVRNHRRPGLWHRYSNGPEHRHHRYHLRLFHCRRSAGPRGRLHQGVRTKALVNALTKMPAVGRISITGTLGYDLSFIREIPTSTGRIIRFVTNRQIRFGEAYYDTQSQNFNLTAGEININTQDKSKSTGMLYPLAQLTLDKEGQLSLELNQNPWRLAGIIDWSRNARPKLIARSPWLAANWHQR